MIGFRIWKQVKTLLAMTKPTAICSFGFQLKPGEPIEIVGGYQVYCLNYIYYQSFWNVAQQIANFDISRPSLL